MSESCDIIIRRYTIEMANYSNMAQDAQYSPSIRNSPEFKRLEKVLNDLRPRYLECLKEKEKNNG